jgi:hypothetical protein
MREIGMDQASNHDASTPRAAGPSTRAPLIWGIVLVAWLVGLCIVPDPRPLGAPEWAVRGVRSLANVSEPTARAVATGILRAAGLGLIGVLMSLALARVRLRYAAPIVLASAPLLSIVVKWINFGYVPIASQLGFIVLFAVLGGLIGLALRRSRIALVALGLISGGLFLWGTSTRVSGDLYEAAKVTGLHVLQHADDVPPGDEGFAALLEIAFLHAEDNSHGVDPVLPNQAAILALGVILGEERIASAARREVDPGTRDARQALRRRIGLRGRGDLSQHFWVSAALVVLSGAGRSLTVGLTKELKDSTPGGSGFSFVDMLANKAGIRFALVATHNETSAREVQLRIAQGVDIEDFMPEIDGLPEGIPRDDFQSQYGGLGGAESRRLLTEIDKRIETRAGLR